MVYKYYVKRGNKVFGPYYYRSYRDGNKTRKEYLGTKDERKETKSTFDENKIKSIFLLSFFVIVILLSVFFPHPGIAGKATLELGSKTFLANEPISGNLNLMLKQGELIPEKTDILVQIWNETYREEEQIELKKLIKGSGIEIEKEQGIFYIENTQLAGQGSGYGLEGIKTIHPFIYFKLEITGTTETGTEFLEQIDASVVSSTPFIYHTTN